jgi:uncharacterized protein YfaS (alpha-2-macroglobulin family)
MEHPSGNQTPARFYFYVIALVLAVAVLPLLQPFLGANGAPGSATYSLGVLHLTIPYRAVHPGTGRLTLEVLDPENHVLGRVEKTSTVVRGPSQWKEEMKLDKPPALDELVWHRLRYSFAYDDSRFGDLQGTESISEILRSPVLRILGQQSYLSGSQAAVRVIVTDSHNETILGRGSLRIDLQMPAKHRTTLFKGQLNHRGTTEAQFQFPAGFAGNCELRYTVDTSLGSTEYTQTIRLQDKVGVLLTSEKPIYQPGQIIHVRALALDRANHLAVGNRDLIFELEDSRGNKVFKEATRTDEFGIAAAEFQLADEVNLGTYHLRGLLSEPGSDVANIAEIALNVQKYVLPKFKVDLDFTSKNDKKTHGYRPGDHVAGTVQANYFFGKSLDSAEVSLKATGMDVTTFEAASVQGKTDRDGTYRFDFRIPSYLAGRPITQGAARLLIEATVKDSAGHAETRGEPITVSKSPFLVVAVPEGGTLIPNLENQVFLLATYPDGSPVKADLKVRASKGVEQAVNTDEGGLAVISLKATPGSETLQIEGKNEDGDSVSSTFSLQLRSGEDQVLLRTEHAVYRVGDPIHLRILATKKRGTVYVDVVKQGQTILTRDLDITDGQAELTLVASPEMAGTADFNAYVFGHNAQPIADHRLIFVQPTEELKIETVAEAAAYKPGDDARIRFRITNSQGQGVRAALGLQIVDEAVFALAEKQPGFAKVFFYLEQEVMKPRYEIHSVSPSEIVELAPRSQMEQRDRAARALFSATEIVSQNKFDTEIGRTIPQTKYHEYWSRYQTQFRADSKKIAEQLRHACANDPDLADVEKVFERLVNSGKAEFRDPWGTPLHLEPITWEPSKTQYVIRSAGPDKELRTGDDLVAYLYFHKRRLVAPASEGKSRVDIRIEHDRGPFTSSAVISGLAVDQWGGAVDGAVVTVRELSTGKIRSVRADASGNFHFSAVPKGSYQLVVSGPQSPGSQAVADGLKLEPRDHAVLMVHLRYALMDEAVEVSSSTEIVATTDAGTVFGGVPGGVAGGAMGGVIGGIVGGADMEMAAPAPARVVARLMTPKAMALNRRELQQLASVVADQDGSPDIHVRSYFPEALYINPEIITDRDGNASISIPVADNITTWRMAMLASTQHGALGTATSSLKVFQDFFVDLDLPVTLTQGDQVSIPVAIYNYSEAKGDVRLSLQSAEWFSLVGDAPEKSVTVDAGRVGSSQFTLEAKRIGKFKLTLAARMKGDAKRADIVVREIEVVPNGREQNAVFNGQLESVVSHNVEFPAISISGASKIFVRLYPGPLSQIMEGMDAILRMPGGCFEQTSSSTYPNVLALDYMKRTKKITPEVHAKAEGFIANGYQRLLTFEVPGGGFSWFGQAPANKILTAYGLMEFYDMSKVHDVDPRLIQRTQQWLASQQLPDGSWKPDTDFINEGATNRYNSDVLRITAYIAWALGNTGYQGGAIEKASQFIQSHLSGKADAYTLAVLANFAIDYGRDRAFTREAIELLLNARTEKEEQLWWSSEETGVYSTGTSASVETTGLAAQALLKWGQAPAATRKALSFLTSKKDASGTWGSTQATIMALRALLLAAEKGTSDVRGKVDIALNGKPVTHFELTSDNSDLFHQFVYKDIFQSSTNRIEVRFEGKGNLGYQVVGQYFVPWDEKRAEQPLSIAVRYDRTHLAQDDIATAMATVRNNLEKNANMVMVDLGIPPGFDLFSEDLQDYLEKSAGQKSGRLQKFSLTATQAILYFDSLAPAGTITLSFRLRAKYPIRAQTFSSRVYEYYDPDVNSVARPVQLEIRKR